MQLHLQIKLEKSGKFDDGASKYVLITIESGQKIAEQSVRLTPHPTVEAFLEAEVKSMKESWGEDVNISIIKS